MVVFSGPGLSCGANCELAHIGDNGVGWIIFSKVIYFFHSKLLIPLCYLRTDTKKKIRSIGGGLGVLQALQNIRPE